MSGDGFSTDRLQVAHWGAELGAAPTRAALIDALEAILTPKVLAPLPPTLQLGGGPQAISNWIADRAAESDVYTIRTGGSLIGLLILAAFPDPGRPATLHLGYLFAETHWGKGYASEMLQGLVASHRAKGTKAILLGGVVTTNPASAHVLRKAGFTRDARMSSDDTDMFRLEV